MAVKIQVEVVWVMMPCSVAVGYHCFRGPCYLHRHPEHYTVSQPRRPQLETYLF
jgi:hypothetical protein